MVDGLSEPHEYLKDVGVVVQHRACMCIYVYMGVEGRTCGWG